MPARAPSFITFTGVDERTPLHVVLRLSKIYPIEWGFLFSPKREGVDRRYPAPEVAWLYKDMKLRLAAHLCGGYAEDVMEARTPYVDLHDFERVQINVSDDDYKYAKVAAAQRFSQIIGKRCILQSRQASGFPEQYDVDWLFDRSGGKGVVSPIWPQSEGRLVGYAGGINADNVGDVIQRVNGLTGTAPGPYWLDMESGVRTDDWLDIEKVEAVCRAVYGDRS